MQQSVLFSNSLVDVHPLPSIVVMVQRMHNVALNWSIDNLEEVNGYLERGTKWHDILYCLYSSSWGTHEQ